jgi:ankyrin repeat protein
MVAQKPEGASNNMGQQVTKTTQKKQKVSLDWTKMHSLVRKNNIAELESCKAHLAKTDENQENLFHSAAYGGNEETCTYLFDNGLKDIDRKNQWGTFPIQMACAVNNSAALKFLLDKKANINVKYERPYDYGAEIGNNYYGSSPYILSLGNGDNLLHICVRKEALDCLLILLHFCEHLIDAKNDSGETSRQIAPHIWKRVVKDFEANWCNPAVELVSQHLINDVAGTVVAYGKLAL